VTVGDKHLYIIYFLNRGMLKRFLNGNGGEKMKKRGIYNIGSLGTIAVVLIVAAIIISVSGTILKKVQDTQDDGANNTDFNVSKKGLDAMLTLGDWLPTGSLAHAI